MLKPKLARMERKKIDFDLGMVPHSLAEFIADAETYDSSCSETAKTIHISGKKEYYLKINGKGRLLRESAMTEFLYSHGFSAKVVKYLSDEENDYLLTEKLPGEDGISGDHLDDPKRLARTFGESLRRLHSLPLSGCPFAKRSEEMLNDAEKNIKIGRINTEFTPEGMEQAVKKLALMRGHLKDEAVIHGDYCLPNIIMDDFSFTGFVDLGYGGVGDRHYDLFWGIWTLNYNLKTDEFRNHFLDAYGKDDIDFDKLDLCRIISSLNE